MAAVNWFEIPASDLARATAFYERVLEAELIPEDIGDGLPKSLIPGADGPIGAVAQGRDWTPSNRGTLVYFDGGDDLQDVLDRVTAAGGQIVEPKQTVDATSGYWARFLDTEGNLIGVLSPR
ncbi:VOC family protein [Demequina sp. NBRC 110053]|uniref:VOC family protein n=1 Tax=Demequina sp. NBRC 110053 TaxID=1570342 RepID=UPI000A061D54|nr:VOC family protein [Demequina sp. NBRC 110053]